MEFYLGQVLSTLQQLIPNTDSNLKSECHPHLSGGGSWHTSNVTGKEPLPQFSGFQLEY